MRAFPAALVAGLCLAMAACTPAKPPTGRWEGTYESRTTMIAARLEIDPNGLVYISAPDAIDIKATDPDDREIIRQRLAMGLERTWPTVPPRKFAFDGTVFRKPGGIAPQMTWNPSTKQMTLVVYPGTQPIVHVKMHRVRHFSADPWP